MGRARRKKQERMGYGFARPDLSWAGLAAHPVVHLALLALLAAVIYSNTFTVPFQFDDELDIAKNPEIKDLQNFLDLSGTRYMGYLSFALNYAVGGLNVFGYHLVNLLIHIANGFLVYILALLVTQTPGVAPLESGRSKRAMWIALATALLFVAHPIQTQAVTYIFQRLASFATLFYLLAVIGYLKWRLVASEARSRSSWYAMALLSTVLAMKTKEIAFTLPFMFLLIEAVFYWPMTRRRWLSILPFLVTLVIIPLSRIDALHGANAGLARVTTEISRAAYLFTQFRVIVTYLRLLVFPVNQTLDYDYPIYHSPWNPPVLVSFLVVCTLLAGAFMLLRRAQDTSHRIDFRLIAFGILWFFLTLLVESSIIPITDVIFEHRLYLPSIGLFLSCMTMVFMSLEALKSRVQNRRVRAVAARPLPAAIFMTVILVLLSGATYQRNAVWKRELTLWEDVVRKSPKNARGHYNLGNAYRALGRAEEAIQEYQSAVALKPTYAQAYTNLGNAYQAQGRLAEAIRAYQQALELQPNLSEAHTSLGAAYAGQGRWEEAIQEYQLALSFNRDPAVAHSNLGTAYLALGRLDEAIRAYQQALTIKPDFTEAYFNLGTLYANQGRLDEAIAAFKQALMLRPDFVEAHYNLGAAYQRTGRRNAAIVEFQRAFAIKPDFLPARQALEALAR